MRAVRGETKRVAASVTADSVPSRQSCSSSPLKKSKASLKIAIEDHCHIMLHFCGVLKCHSNQTR